MFSLKERKVRVISTVCSKLSYRNTMPLLTFVLLALRWHFYQILERKCELVSIEFECFPKNSCDLAFKWELNQDYLYSLCVCTKAIQGERKLFLYPLHEMGVFSTSCATHKTMNVEHPFRTTFSRNSSWKHPWETHGG